MYLDRQSLSSPLPGPKGLLILGNLLQIDLHKLHLILEEWAGIYGGIYQFKLANKPVIAISDTELIQQILRDRPQTYRRTSPIARITKELGTHGVFAAEGEQWQRHRTLTMQAFRPENLRLKSVAPMLYLEPMTDVQLNGFKIRKGTTLILLTRHGALEEQNFSEAGAFKPERWLDGNSACPHNRNAFIPFGAGPRFCPGRNLAMLAIKMVIAMVFRNFNVIRQQTGLPVQELFSFTMMPENLRVKFDPR
jgi:cytochrome P450